MSRVKTFLTTWRWPPPMPARSPSGPPPQGRLGRLPPLAVKAHPNHFQVITAPSPEFIATLHNGAGEQVGTVKYGVSPLLDRIYVYDIRVPTEHQRCGYAMACLWHLAREYGRPITPVQELHAASGFWNAARALADEGVIVTEPVYDLDAEAARWAHLRPLADRLAAQILARLDVRREPWYVAVGRGLDAEAATLPTASAPPVETADGPSPG
ncbi:MULTISPECIES: hypothetical protein [Cupriavidus]